MKQAPSDSHVFLVCPHTKTYRLNKNHPLTIGREKYNDIVLNDLLVSRQHAVIRWENTHFILKDLKSRNGSYLNQKPVKSAPLEDGDLVKVGGYEFTVRASTHMDVEKYLLREKVRMASHETLIGSDLGLQFNDQGFSGNLSTLTLDEVIQTLAQCLKSGLLTITREKDKQNPSKIYFEDGEIVHAVFADLEGVNAVYAILALTDGAFNFQNGVSSPSISVEQSTISILLEGCRKKDESHRQETHS